MNYTWILLVERNTWAVKPGKSRPRNWRGSPAVHGCDPQATGDPAATEGNDTEAVAAKTAQSEGSEAEAVRRVLIDALLVALGDLAYQLVVGHLGTAKHKHATVTLKSS